MAVFEKREDYIEVIKYKKRVTGKDLVERGLDPRDDSKLDEVFKDLEDEKLEVRFDPLFGRKNCLHTTIISKVRSKTPKPVKMTEDSSFVVSECVFCKPKVFLETAVPKIYHFGGKIISIPNKFPFMYPHYVTIFTDEHKQRIEELNENDIRAYLLTGKDIAMKLRGEGYDKMFDFFQWGHLSSSSQPHPHAQRGGVSKFMNNLNDLEIELLEKRKKELGGKDPFEWYFEFIRKNDLLIYEDDFCIVFAPFAPKFTNQVDILTKKVKGKIVSNYLELSDKCIEYISNIMIKILKKLVTKLNAANFNVYTHQADFSGSSSYRIHWHIYPRYRPLGGVELDGIYVSNIPPEETAKILREE